MAGILQPPTNVVFLLTSLNAAQSGGFSVLWVCPAPLRALVTPTGTLYTPTDMTNIVSW